MPAWLTDILWFVANIPTFITIVKQITLLIADISHPAAKMAAAQSVIAAIQGLKQK